MAMQKYLVWERFTNMYSNNVFAIAIYVNWHHIFIIENIIWLQVCFQH